MSWVWALSLLLASATPAPAADYDVGSVFSEAARLPAFSATLPAVNSAGTLAFAGLVFDPADNRSEYVVFRSDGVQLLRVLNLTDQLGVGSPSSLVINDAGAIAVNYSMGSRAVIVRIDAGGAATVLAEADEAGSLPYRAFPTSISLNSAGQVAALVTNQDSTSSIVRLHESGTVEIARSGSGLLNFSSPTLNSSGVVAFTAVLASGSASIYSGAGGPLTNEGIADPCWESSAHPPVINDDGFVLGDCGNPPLFTARAGVVSVLLSGSEDPIFARLVSSYSLNNRGVPAFVTGSAGPPREVGLFTGHHPVDNKVVRTGDLALGLPVQDIRVGQRSINDAGQIVFLLEVGDGTTVTSHVVLATPRRMPQTITFPPLVDLTFRDAPFVVAATASSGLPATFAADGSCSVADGTVTLLGAGACTITASQAGDSVYLPAPDVAHTFTVGRASQTIEVAPTPDRTFGEPPFTVSATASSGLPVTFSAAGGCSIAGDLVTIAGGGPCTVTASQSGDENYQPAPNVARTFTVARAAQTLAFGPLADRTFGDPPFAVTATASSGLPVTFSAAGPCAIGGNTVTLIGAGSCTVTASQDGNANYETAIAVAQSFAVAQASQTITFATLPDRAFGDAPFTVTATASSGLSVTFSVTGSCSLTGAGVTITGAGACTVTASQPGNVDNLPAPAVARSFAIARAGQTITFGPLPNRPLSEPPFALPAAASSGLPISFTATGPCSVSEATASVSGAGSCTITASQVGNDDFDPAPAVARTFLIAGVILEARFDAGPEGFSYFDDTFRGTANPDYASGAWITSGGFKGGALRVTLGGIDNTSVQGMSGGWRMTFSLGAPTKVILHVRGNLIQSPDYESDEKSQLLVSVDGLLVGVSPNDYLAQVAGDGNLGSNRATGWRLFQVNLGTLDAGKHSLVIGGYNNKKTNSAEFTTVLIDDLLLMDATAGARVAVAALDLERFKDNIRILADFGDRTQGTPSNDNANRWLENQLRAAGYTVERHPYTYQGQPRFSVYATKVGTLFPDHMYIVSAHMDGRGGGGAANDDASGCSLVLEAARALAGLQTALSIRFVFWNNEETGLNGSTAYVTQRVNQQGVENPPGSGHYPEPRWLGMIQHDQILFDHGLPPQPNQNPAADIDVEYQASSTYASQSLQLANALRAGNQTYSTSYPAQVGSNMNYTDSVPFRNYTAAVSVRDNQRVAEIGQGSNPHWHQPTDVYAAFSEADFRLGFNAVQMTLGTVAELTGATIVP